MFCFQYFHYTLFVSFSQIEIILAVLHKEIAEEKEYSKE